MISTGPDFPHDADEGALARRAGHIPKKRRKKLDGELAQANSSEHDTQLVDLLGALMSGRQSMAAIRGHVARLWRPEMLVASLFRALLPLSVVSYGFFY